LAGLPGKNGTDGFDGRNGLPGGMLLKILKNVKVFLKKYIFGLKKMQTCSALVENLEKEDLMEEGKYSKVKL